MRRLYQVELYDGDPDDPDTPIITETVVAWNATDAMRRCAGRAAVKEPTALHYVTWEDDSGGLYRIESTAGPSDEEVAPSIDPDPDFEDPFSKRSTMARAEAKAEKPKAASKKKRKSKK